MFNINLIARTRRNSARGLASQSRSWAMGVATAALVGVNLTPLPSTGDPTSIPAPSPSDIDVQATDIVLPTGDRIAWREYSDGRFSYEVDPAPRPDGRPIGFLGHGTVEHFYLYPTDAIASLTADPGGLAEFDVTALATGNPGRPTDTPAAADEGGHSVTIEVIDRTGAPATDVLGVYAIQDSYDLDAPVGEPSYAFYPEHGTADTTLPAGTYSFLTVVPEFDEATGDVVRVSLVIEPSVFIQGNTTITLDARTAVPTSVTTPMQSETRLHAITLTHGYAAFPGLSFSMPAMFWDDTPIYVTPAPAVDRVDGFTAQLEHWTLAEPVPLSSDDPWLQRPGGSSQMPEYIYNLPFVYPNGIPADLHHTVADTDLVSVPTVFHADRPEDVYVAHGLAAVPYSYPLVLPVPRIHVRPGETTEYLLADDDFIWARHTGLYRPQPIGEAMFHQVSFDAFTSDEAGTARPVEHWFAAPVRTGTVELDPKVIAEPYNGLVKAFLTRGGPDGNEFLPGVHAMDNTLGHFTEPRYRENQYAEWTMINTTTGQPLLDDWKYGYWPVFHLAPGPAEYRLEAVEKYPHHNARLFKTRPVAQTVWTFHSRPSQETVPTG